MATLPVGTGQRQRVVSALREVAASRTASLIYPVLAIVGLVAWFGAKSPAFLTVDNAWNIGRQSAVLLLVALAGTLVILIGSIDLSVGGIVVLTGVICASLINDVGTWAGVLAALAVGAAVGLANGSLLLVLRIPSFLVTLGMLSVLTGIAYVIASGSPVPFVAFALPDLINGEVAGVPNVILITLGVLAILIVAVFRTRFGRYLYAIGGGESVAAASGVPVARYKVLAFVLGGLLCGLAGVVITGQVGAGTLTVGSDLLLDSIAAVVMGGTALSGGVGGPHRTLLGVLVIAILGNGMDITGVQEYTQDIVKGAVIIAAVGLSIDRKRYSAIK
jgi:ribose transport system permease protein/putative xylitol transport system permease protein